MVSANFASAGDYRPSMSQLARAFTTIGKRKPARFDADSSNNMPSSAHLGRAASQRAGRLVLPADISAPLALMSTSNLQVHNAKHIAGTNHIEIHHVGDGPVDSSASTSSSNASVSGDESDNMTVLSGHDGGALTDASSVDMESPIRSEPEPNHLSCYFKPSVDTSKTVLPHHRSRSSTASSTSPAVSPALSGFSDAEATSPESTPRLPQREPSHSKRAHERLHRTRSLQRTLSTTSSPRRSGGAGALSRSASTTSSLANKFSSASFVEAPRDSTSSPPTPFGNELAQLDEIAEEFGAVVHKAELEAESALLTERGFAVLGADVYCAEIAALVEETFGAGALAGGEVGWF